MAQYFANTEEVAAAIVKLENLHSEFTTAATAFTAKKFDDVKSETWSGKAVEAFRTCLISVNDEVSAVLERVKTTRSEIDGVLNLVKAADAEFRSAYDTAQADLITSAEEVTSLMPGVD